MRNRYFIHNGTAIPSIKLLKKIVLLFFSGFLCLGSMANTTLATKQQIEMFKNTTTCVVLEDGVSFYNAYIKDAVQKYWKSTTYEFIDLREFERRRNNPKYSFLVLIDAAYDKDPSGVSYSYVSLVLGDQSDNMTRMPEFCTVPLIYTGDTETDYEYIIPSIIKFMQIHVKNLEKDRLPISVSGLRFYNKAGLKDKVLILNKDKMASNADTQDKISAVYPYKIKLMTAADIKEEIGKGEMNIIFNYHVGPPQGAGAGKCFDMIFDTDGNLYYYSTRKITNDNKDGFNLNDFKNIK